MFAVSLCLLFSVISLSPFATLPRLSCIIGNWEEESIGLSAHAHISTIDNLQYSSLYSLHSSFTKYYTSYVILTNAYDCDGAGGQAPCPDFQKCWQWKWPFVNWNSIYVCAFCSGDCMPNRTELGLAGTRSPPLGEPPSSHSQICTN